MKYFLILSISFLFFGCEKEPIVSHTYISIWVKLYGLNNVIVSYNDQRGNQTIAAYNPTSKDTVEFIEDTNYDPGSLIIKATGSNPNNKIQIFLSHSPTDNNYFFESSPSLGQANLYYPIP